jgi:hypothetical protein
MITLSSFGRFTWLGDDVFAAIAVADNGNFSLSRERIPLAISSKATS